MKRRWTLVARLGLASGLFWAGAGQAFAGLALEGRLGFVQEWALDATLAEDPASSGAAGRLYRGTASIRHVGLCSVSGAETKQAAMTVKTRPWSRHITVDVVIDGLACRGSVSPGSDRPAFLDCAGGPSVPLSLAAPR